VHSGQRGFKLDLSAVAGPDYVFVRLLSYDEIIFNSFNKIL
jgi:hypothetical protein